LTENLDFNFTDIKINTTDLKDLDNTTFECINESDTKNIIYNIPELELNVEIKFARYTSENIKTDEEIQKINNVFEWPILNKNINVFSQKNNIPYIDIGKLLRPFEIIVTPEQLNKDEFRLSSDLMHKVTFDNLSLYLCRNFSASWEYLLFVIEYERNSNFYDINVKIGTGRDEIIERFGEPNCITEDIFIYDASDIYRRMDIAFDNDTVTKVQLIRYYESYDYHQIGD